jgi:hypothetical protein
MSDVPTSVFMAEDQRREIELNRQAKAAFGAWLNEIAWHHFVTLTFKYSVGVEAARHEMARWIRRLEQRAQQAVRYFWVLEPDAAGDLHAHVLLHGTGHLGCGQIRCAWRNGNSEARVFDPESAGAFYVTKSTGSEPDDYDLRL